MVLSPHLVLFILIMGSSSGFVQVFPASPNKALDVPPGAYVGFPRAQPGSRPARAVEYDQREVRTVPADGTIECEGGSCRHRRDTTSRQFPSIIQALQLAVTYLITLPPEACITSSTKGCPGRPCSMAATRSLAVACCALAIAVACASVVAAVEEPKSGLIRIPVKRVLERQVSPAPLSAAKYLQGNPEAYAEWKGLQQSKGGDEAAETLENFMDAQVRGHGVACAHALEAHNLLFCKLHWPRVS